MAETIYQKAIYEMIVFKDEIREKIDELTKSTNEDIRFTKVAEGCIACTITFHDYNVAFQIEEREVFEYAMKEGRKPSEAVEDVIKEKLFAELNK